MKTLIFLAILSIFLPYQLYCQEPAPATPAPVIVVQAAPAPQSAIDKGTSIALAVITAVGTVVTALALLLVNIAPKLATIKATLEELRGRQDRQNTKTENLQAQVNNVALAVSPPAAQEAAKPRPGGDEVL